MPYASNQGVRIHYKVEGDSPPLVLQHGYTQNLERWYQCEYVDALKSHYRLILIDARGHGASDKPHDISAYAKQIPQATFISLPGLNHTEAFRNADLVLHPVKEFLKIKNEDVTATEA